MQNYKKNSNDLVKLYRKCLPLPKKEETMNRICAFLAWLMITLHAFSQAPADSLQARKDSLSAVAADSLAQPALVADSLVQDSLRTDSLVLPTDSLALDSLVADSLLVDSLVADSLLADSLVADSLLADSLLADTIIEEINPVKIIQIDPLDTIRRAYMARIEKLALKRDSIAINGTYPELDAYFYRLLLPPTLYHGALHGVLTTRDSSYIDPKMQRMHAIHYALARTYVQYPWLINQTEQDLANVGTLRHDITEQSIQNQGKLSEKLPEVALPPELHDTVVVVTRRPNFWKVSGSTSLKFSQNHYSKNWFRGGVDAFSGMSTLNLSANFNNQRKITWDNSLAAQLGFQTAKGDTRRAFRPTSNNVRLNTKIGYKMWKTIYYTTSVQLSTNIVPNYNSGTDVCKADFLSPLDITVGVGLDYKFSKKKFSGSLVVAPVAYTIRYVQRKSLVTNNGIRPGHHSSHGWGPSINFNANWPIFKNVNWKTRVFWFSNLSYTQIDWENNFDFTLSKYISAALNIYPRFDDSAPRYKNENGKYLMLQEWFNIGLNYSF